MTHYTHGYSKEFSDTGFLDRARRQWQCDGFALAYNFPGPSALREQIADRRFPAVWFNQKQKWDTVYPDNTGGGVVVARHFVELGHRRLAWVSAPRQGDLPEHFSVRDREAGARRVIEKAGGTLMPVTLGSLDPREQLDELGKLLRARKRSTAWICYSPRQAKVLVTAALILGLRVPDDLSVATFGSTFDSSSDGLRIQHATEFFDRMGSALGEMLIRKIENPEEALPSIKIPMEMAQGGETTARL
jgi:DNA-binding LacI/PurR family transcriptional regulator